MSTHFFEMRLEMADLPSRCSAVVAIPSLYKTLESVWGTIKFLSFHKKVLADDVPQEVKDELDNLLSALVTYPRIASRDGLSSKELSALMEACSLITDVPKPKLPFSIRR